MNPACFIAFFGLVIPALVRAETTLVVTGVKADTGLLLVAVYSDGGTWLGKTPLVGLNILVKRDTTGRVVVAIPGKLPEKVAVAIIHDVNSNRELDRNAIGIPTEPYGFSRGVRPSFGPPKFHDAITSSGQPIEVKVDTLL